MKRFAWIDTIEWFSIEEFLVPNVFSEISCLCDEKKEVNIVARTPGKARTFSVPANALSAINSWKTDLEQKGFDVNSVEYNGEGEIVSATCSKNDREQVITPEIKEQLRD
ncbi:MAG: hypothetical protein ACR2QF_00935 [Geminicoccaceae bacterium]